MHFFYKNCKNRDCVCEREETDPVLQCKFVGVRSQGSTYIVVVSGSILMHHLSEPTRDFFVSVSVVHVCT